MKRKPPKEWMIIINFDGWNVGFFDGFSSTWLEFETMFDAIEVAGHWNYWIEGL